VAGIAFSIANLGAGVSTCASAVRSTARDGVAWLNDGVPATRGGYRIGHDVDDASTRTASNVRRPG
jgi:hypothetical protein